MKIWLWHPFGQQEGKTWLLLPWQGRPVPTRGGLLEADGLVHQGGRTDQRTGTSTHIIVPADEVPTSK